MLRVLSTLRDAFSNQGPRSGFVRAGLALYTLGSRRVPAAEATLIASQEVPLTPLWVWLAFGEAVSPSTLIGGALVFSALVGHILIGNRPFATPVSN
jgi:drug/metabolite transporter (DMT)-like permease